MLRDPYTALRVVFDGTNDSLSHSQVEIAAECDRVKGILLEKNRAYGDSVCDPVRIFSKASAEEQILVRLDDKLSRIARGQAAGEDVTLDLIGYLVLLRVARARRVQSEDNAALDVIDDEIAKALPKRRR